MSQRTFSYKQYRAADLTIFLILLCVLEAVIETLAKQWSNTTFYVVSLFYAVVAIVMMRWNGWSALHCVAAAAVLCIVDKADAMQWLSYIVGNCCALLCLLMFRFVGKEKIRNSVWLTLAYLVAMYAAVNLGRATMLSATKAQSFWNMVKICFSTDSLSGVIAAVIVFIARKQNGLFEDQKHYLLRTEEERREELKNKPQD